MLGGNLRTQKFQSVSFPSRFFDGSQHLFALQVDAERAKRGVTVLKFSSAVCISGFHASILETEGASKKLENFLAFCSSAFPP